MDPQNPTIPTPPPQVTPPAVSPVLPKKNNLVVILLSVFLVITLLISGYLFLQVQNLTKQLAQLQAQPTPIPLSTEIPSPTPDPTANWKTYKDENIKVQFKYPSNWKYEVINSKSNAGFNYTQITLAKTEYFDPIPKGKPLIMITVSNTTDQNLLSVYQNTKITGDIKVDDIPAEVRQHNSASVDSKYITFTKGEQSFEIESSLHTQSAEQEIILNQILSTFKFTD